MNVLFRVIEVYTISYYVSEKWVRPQKLCDQNIQIT